MLRCLSITILVGLISHSSLLAQEKLLPLATQSVDDFKIEVWSVDPIDAQKLSTNMGKDFGIDSNFDELVRSRPTPNANAPLKHSHILGLQVRSKNGDRLPASIEVLKGQKAIDDLQNESSEPSFGGMIHSYKWDRPFLVAVPVAVGANAKEIVKVEGALAVQPANQESFVLKLSDLKSKDPIRQGAYAIAINEFQNKNTEVALTFSLFSPEPKLDSNQRDNFMERVESMKNMAYVRATLIAEDGKAYSSNRNASVGMQRKFDSTMMRTLQRDLTAKLREQEQKNSSSSKAKAKISYELNINNYLSAFNNLPSNTRIKQIVLDIVKPTDKAFPIQYSLEHIPLDARRTTSQLEAACNTPVNSGLASDAAPNMLVEKTQIDLEKDGKSTKIKSTIEGNGSRVVVVDNKQSMRTWRAAAGGFAVEATLVSADSKEVQLQKKDGKTIKVPIAKLSTEDQEFLYK